MGSIRRPTLLAAIAAISLMGATCNGPEETPTPTATAAAIGAVEGSFKMLFPWPTRGAVGKALAHPWTGGPHAWNTEANSPCTSDQPCAADVPKRIRSGMDFGTGGKPDWDVYAVGPGTLVYEGSFGDTGFGDGAVTQHGDLFVLYAHMDRGSLPAASDVGKPVDHGTKMGKTACSGCSKTESDHLHLELRSGMTFSNSAVTSYGEHVKWEGRTIGGWTITAGTLNYNGTATAPVCSPSTITADRVGPDIYDASTCGGTAQVAPTPTATSTRTPTSSPTLKPTPAPSAIRSAPFPIPSHAWFVPYVKQSAAWLLPDATVLSVGEIDLVEVSTYEGSAVACSTISYEQGGATKSGALGPIFGYLSGTLEYNNSAAMGPSGGGIFKSVNDCVAQGLEPFGSWFVATVLP